MSNDAPVSVAALTSRLQATLNDFGPLLVIGELSGVKVMPSGHLYATLKDEGAVISLVMWRSTIARGGVIPTDGSRVIVRGTLDVYPPRGSYQIVASRITLAGIGDLAAQLEALKAKLTAEGLFNEDDKRPLPFLPRAVGLATGAGSAALADLLHSLRERFPTMPVVVAPCLVQGRGAAASIVAAIKRLEAHPEVDVIIAGRGGGSLEDLWAFNEEPVVRAIAACSKTIVSAVGHETDWTLADLAADVRAKTPTAAGELVVPVESELRATLLDGHTRLHAGIARIFTEARERLKSLAAHRALSGPGHQVALRRQRLDELRATLDGTMTSCLTDARARLAETQASLRPPTAQLAAERERLARAVSDLSRAATERSDRAGERLAAVAARLDALSPLAVLGRGYSVMRTAERKLIKRMSDAPPGTQVEARVNDGWIYAEAVGVKPQRLGEPDDEYGNK